MQKSSLLVYRRQQRRQMLRYGVQKRVRTLVSLTLSAALALVILMMTGLAATLALYAYFTRDLPSADALQTAFSPANTEFFQTTRLYDRTGQHVIYEVIDPRGGDRQYLAYAAIPPEMISATIALEDRSFFENPGYDLWGIGRALVSNLQGLPIQGGSSITQQLVKNTLIPLEERAERSYERKIREVLLAAEITRRYTKEQILEWYLNTNFYGNLAYGIDAAARVYFGKSAANLTLAEAALLAAIPQSPGLNPVDTPAAAVRRQQVTLEAMVAAGYLTPAQAAAAQAAPLTIQPPVQRFDIRAPHFAVWVRQQLVQWYGEDVVNRGGLKVITTLDVDLQNQAECVARTQIARLSGQPADTVQGSDADSACPAAVFLPPLKPNEAGVDRNVTNAAVVMLRPQTGEVLALLGSRNYWDTSISGNFNIAVNGLRQPGSSFKPFTYLEALRQGLTPASMVLDVRRTFRTTTGEAYVPENYDRQFHGPVSVRQALARSYNIPAVALMDTVGVDNVLRLAHRLGLNTLELGQHDLALALGGGEVTLLDMTYAYSVLANSGTMAGQPVPTEAQRPGYRTLDPVSILRVEDRLGHILYEYASPRTQPILSADLAYLLNHILADTEARQAAFGRDNPLELPGRVAAAKTGTTNDFRDNWTLGYGPQLAVGVWVGNANAQPMIGVTGLTGAAPIWHALMRYAAETRALPPEGWPAPPNIITLRVCMPSGLLPSPNCQQTRPEIFIQGTEPTAADTLWQTVTVNRETGNRATVCTPPELREARVFLVLPPEAADWAQRASVPQPPNTYDPLTSDCAQAAQGTSNAVLNPTPFAYVRGTVNITGVVSGDNLAFFRLQYGAGLFPTQFVQIGDDRAEPVDPPGSTLQWWDTTGLNGLYVLQLVVAKNDPAGGPPTLETQAVPLTVDNLPPTVTVIAPQAGQIFSVGDESVVVQPQVRDNLSVARVVVFVNGASTETLTVPPYSTRVRINRPGTYTVFVRAYDAAGNQTDTPPVTIEVR